ncbi:hypothetical protein [Phenylobacterium hankyongense]|nr:hypothetical protein [Phenylobacterium hankyongense]
METHGGPLAALAAPWAGDLTPRPEAAALRLPNHAVVSALFGAMMAAGPNAGDCGWRTAGQSVSNVQRIGLSWLEVRLEAAHVDDAWLALRGVSPLCVDVLALLMSGPSEGGPAGVRLIRAADILEAKGYRRWGDERRGLERQLACEMLILRRLSAGLAGELLFKLSPLDAGGCDFVYEPGAWLNTLLQSAPPQFLDARILRFDHRANRGADVLAKKLAVHLTCSTAARGSAVRTVRSLLQSAGVPRQDLASRRGRGGRLVDRFDEAVLRLQEHGLFQLRYRGRPSTGAPADRVKGWVREWLDTEMAIRRLRPAEAPRAQVAAPMVPEAFMAPVHEDLRRGVTRITAPRSEGG